VGKRLLLAIVAPQGVLRKFHYLEIPFGTLSNYALCISWAFGHLPKNISEIKLGVKCIGILRNILGIPDEKMVVCGVAIGYPECQHPDNNLQSPRELVEVFSRWHGF